MDTVRQRSTPVETLAEWLLLACVFLSSFTALSFWPHWYSKIQPTEIAFVVLLPLALIAYGRTIWPPARWSLVLAAYLAANLCSGFASGARESMVESLGRGYLLTLGVIIAAYVRRGGPGNTRRVAMAWLLGGLLEGTASVAGYAAALAGYENVTVRVFPNYPYVGTVYRAAGFVDTPGMLVIVLGFPILFLFALGSRRAWRTIGLVILGLTHLLTLSKELALIVMGLCVLHPFLDRRPAKWRTMVVAVTAVALWGATHAVLLFKTPVESSYLAGMPYTSGRVLARIGNVQVIETVYTALKRANWLIGLEHPVLGVGPGRSNSYLAALKAANIYPAYLPNFDPHSTWMGAFSETGVLGFLALAVMVAGWVRLVQKGRFLSSPDPALRALAAYVLILLIESVMIDAMNFRQVWIAAGLLLGQKNAGSEVNGSGNS